jgi:quinol-cytochrome oxidoreductase complex cytochrome b subunit
VSVAALVVAAVVIAMGVLVGVFALAFLDSCYAPRCSEGGAWTAVGAGLVAAAVVGVAGMVATISRITRRRPAWPFAVSGLALAALVLAVGAIGYTAAVSG